MEENKTSFRCSTSGPSSTVSEKWQELWGNRQILGAEDWAGSSQVNLSFQGARDAWHLCYVYAAFPFFFPISLLSPPSLSVFKTEKNSRPLKCAKNKLFLSKIQRRRRN